MKDHWNIVSTRYDSWKKMADVYWDAECAIHRSSSRKSWRPWVWLLFIRTQDIPRYEYHHKTIKRTHRVTMVAERSVQEMPAGRWYWNLPLVSWWSHRPNTIPVMSNELQSVLLPLHAACFQKYYLFVRFDGLRHPGNFGSSIHHIFYLFFILQSRCLGLLIGDMLMLDRRSRWFYPRCPWSCFWYPAASSLSCTSWRCEAFDSQKLPPSWMLEMTWVMFHSCFKCNEFEAKINFRTDDFSSSNLRKQNTLWDAHLCFNGVQSATDLDLETSSGRSEIKRWVKASWILGLWQNGWKASSTTQRLLETVDPIKKGDTPWWGPFRLEEICAVVPERVNLGIYLQNHQQVVGKLMQMHIHCSWSLLWWYAL